MFESIGALFANGMRAFASFVVDRLVMPIVHAMGHELLRQTRSTIDSVVPPGDQPDKLKQALDRMQAGEGEWQSILGGAAAGSATGGLISSTIGPFLLLLQYEVQRSAKQARWDPMTAAAILFRRPDLEELIKSDVADLGWTNERWQGLVEAAMTRLKEEDLALLRRRWGLSQEDYYKYMHELGYSRDRAEYYYKSRQFYPSPSDLVHWQAREVFEPEMISRYGLDDELGGIQREPFYRAGMDDEQITNYWRAHWEHASWTQVVEMFHRGQMTEQEIWDWFRLVEIPPFWRDKLIAIAYRPFTRVDVRRMYNVGVLDREGVKRAYLDIGYTEEKAEAMTEFTIRYTVTADRDLTKTDILSSYRKGKIDEDTARELLGEIDYGEDEIEFLLVKEEVAETTRQRDLTVSNYRQLYLLGVMDKSGVTAALAELGFDATEIELIYQLWDVEAPPKTSQPSRTDLRHFLESGIIDLTTWAQEMSNLGYSPRYISWYLAEIQGKEGE